MSAETQSAALLIVRDLAMALVDDPAALQIAEQVADDGAVFIVLKCARADEPRLVGRAGAHVKAMEFLVHLIGLNTGQPHTFRLATDGEPDTRRRENRVAVEYNAERTVDLLGRTLDAIGIETETIAWGPGNGSRNNLSYEFAIRAPAADVFWLKHRPNNVSFERMVPISVLETIFGAIGKREGVKLKLALHEVN